MADSPDAAKTEDGAPKAPGSGNKLLIIIALANFLGVFGLGGYLLYDKLYASHAAAQASPKPSTEHGKAGEHGGDKAAGHGAEKGDGHAQAADDHLNPPDGPGPIMALEPIVTNLSEPDSDRYLKVTVQLRITSEAAKAEVEASLVPIRSQMLMFFSSLNIEALSGAEKRRAIQAQVRRIANEAMPSSRIRYVYFTEFVIQ